jgi:hypothetical protein
MQIQLIDFINSVFFLEIFLKMKVLKVNEERQIKTQKN